MEKIETGERTRRILYLPLFEAGHEAQKVGKRGLREALKRVGLVVEWDYVNFIPHPQPVAPYGSGENANRRDTEGIEVGDSPHSLPLSLRARGEKQDIRSEFVRLVEAWQPDLILTQIHDCALIDAGTLAAVRAVCPCVVIANWNGDVYAQNLLHPDMLALLRCVDVQLTVNAGVLDAYARLGIRAAYWQVAFEEVNPSPLPLAHKGRGGEKSICGTVVDISAYDVVFLGNGYSEARRRLAQWLYALGDELGIKVGVFGGGYARSEGENLYDFAAGEALYRRAKLILGDNQYPTERGFVSNRLFQALAAGGGLLLHQFVPGLRDLTGLQAGVHYVVWSDLDDLRFKIRYWLDAEREDVRARIAARGRVFVWERHSFDARVRELFEIIAPLTPDPSPTRGEGMKTG